MTNPSTKAERDQRHDAKRYEVNPWRKWYNTASWRRLRKLRLAQEPLCRMCSTDDMPIPGEVVDHITEHKGDRDLFFDYENTQSLCKYCHDSVKQRLERFGEIGCDEDGMPLDADHSWG